MESFQVTVADKDGVVVDTGWVTLSRKNMSNPITGELVAGATLFDTVLSVGLDQGIMETLEDSLFGVEEDNA